MKATLITIDGCHVMNLKSLDTSSELRICLQGNGIKLIRPLNERPEKNSFLPRDTGYTVADALQSNCSIYFLDSNSTILNGNERCAKICGFASVNNMISKSLLDTFRKERAIDIIHHDKKVLQTQQPCVVEELACLMTETGCWAALTIKVPWYNDQNKIIGVFGGSIRLGQQNIASFLSRAAELGLRIPSKMAQVIIENAHLSKREIEILYYLTRGKTAKKIAHVVNLSHRTVELHLQNIKRKLNVSCQSELIEKVVDYFNHSTYFD